MQRAVYIRWRDAMTDEQGDGPAKAELAELEEIGWLLAETADAIQIGMELEPRIEGLTGAGRWRLTIPRSGIVEMKEMRVVMPKKSRKRMSAQNAKEVLAMSGHMLNINEEK